MIFEWDSNKNDINLEKHGLSFTLAAIIFEDKNHISTPDQRKDYKEIRYITTGTAYGVVITVVHTHRKKGSKEINRIISARKASKNERRKYHEAQEYTNKKRSTKPQKYQ